jgi:hypothetical protein
MKISVYFWSYRFYCALQISLRDTSPYSKLNNIPARMSSTQEYVWDVFKWVVPKRHPADDSTKLGVRCTNIRPVLGNVFLVWAGHVCHKAALHTRLNYKVRIPHDTQDGSIFRKSTQIWYR